MGKPQVMDHDGHNTSCQFDEPASQTRTGPQIMQNWAFDKSL